MKKLLYLCKQIGIRMNTTKNTSLGMLYRKRTKKDCPIICTNRRKALPLYFYYKPYAEDTENPKAATILITA